MNINQDISGQTFSEIKQLAAGHPVFLVTTSDDIFVIKAENSSSNKLVSFSAEVMNFIDSNSASRVLNKKEIFAIRNFASANAASLIELTPGTLNNFITLATKATFTTYAWATNRHCSANRCNDHYGSKGSIERY